MPRGDFAIEDTWRVAGLKATGSHDVVVKDAFVPDYRRLRWIDNFNGVGPGQAVNTSVLVDAVRSTTRNVLPPWTNEKWDASIHLGIATVPPCVTWRVVAKPTTCSSTPDEVRTALQLTIFGASRSKRITCKGAADGVMSVPLVFMETDN